MRIWRSHSQPGDHQPTVTSRRGAMSDEAFDDLAKAAGKSTNRRGALKILVLGVAGAAAGGGVLAAANASTSAVRRRATTSLTSQCPPLMSELCCTDYDFNTCDRAAGREFVKALEPCIGQCSHRRSASASCRHCISTATRRSTATYTNCISAMCVTLQSARPTPPTLPAPQPQAAPVNTEAPLPTASLLAYQQPLAASCDWGRFSGCMADSTSKLDLCLARCGLSIGAGKMPICAPVCFASHSFRDLSCAKMANSTCPPPTFCTPDNICCDVSEVPCINKCCPPGENCRGGSCTTCGGENCAAGETCCADSFTGVKSCADLNTDVNNCGSCGNACPEGVPCVGGGCGPPGSPS